MGEARGPWRAPTELYPESLGATLDVEMGGTDFGGALPNIIAGLILVRSVSLVSASDMEITRAKK